MSAPTEIETFLAHFAAANLIAQKQNKWLLNFPFINARGAELGVADHDLMPGGKHALALAETIDAMHVAVRALGKNDSREAEQSAENLYGPAGELARNWMVRA